MSLTDWKRNGWLRSHQTNPKQVTDLFAIVDRDLTDAEKEYLSADWQFGIAYNAALKLYTILLYAEGYRPEKSLAHYRTLLALPLIMGSSYKDDADYLDACRAKRNTVEYEAVGVTSQTEADELIAFCKDLRTKVTEWLKKNHSKLIKE